MTKRTLRSKLSQKHQTMLDLLKYPNAAGIHPDEARWRDFARTAIQLATKQVTKRSRSRAIATPLWNHERAGLG